MLPVRRDLHVYADDPRIGLVLVATRANRPSPAAVRRRACDQRQHSASFGFSHAFQPDPYLSFPLDAARVVEKATYD
jgi:hypothetical protein